MSKRHRAPAHPPASIKIAATNIDFGTPQAKDVKIIDLLDGKQRDLIGVVEAKVDDLHHMKPDKHWRVEQSLRNHAVQGSGIMWDSRVVKPFKRRAAKLGSGFKLGQRVAKMLPRYMRILDIWMEAPGGRAQKVRVVVFHWAPQRYSWLWVVQTLAVKARLAAVKWSRRGHWVVFADCNTKPATRAKQLGAGDWHGSDVMLIAAGKRMRLTDKKVYPKPKAKGWTDHHAIGATLAVKS